MSCSRRDFIKLAGSGLIVAGCAPSLALAAYPDKPRALAFKALNTGESLETCYFNGSDYIKNELSRINYLCRDFRCNEVHVMDKYLFDQISLIQAKLGVESEVMVISGYRSPATNEALRKNSTGVAKHSYHMLGQAIDFRLDGVKLQDLRDAAISLKAGGVGYYPRSNFIHIDTGPVRQWS